MTRIKTVATDQLDEKGKQLIENVDKRMGFTPNMMKTMAHSTAALKSYLDINATLSLGKLPPKLRDQIALAVSEFHDCRYCLAAHTEIGRKNGLSDEEIQKARQGLSDDIRTTLILQFALELAENRGLIHYGSMKKLRSAGVSDGEIVEIIANVSLTTFTNYFNLAVEPEIDFPEEVDLWAEEEQLGAVS